MSLLPHVIPALAMTASLSTTPADLGRLRLEREHSFNVALPLAQAFVFFEPIGEKLWAEDWQPVFVSAEDAALQAGSVFIVPTRTPSGRPVEAVWSVARYEAPDLIEYRNVIPGVRATCVRVRCKADGPERTRVVVRYTYHSLSDEGDEFVRGMTGEKFSAMIDSWGEAIAAYLVRGTPASP